MLDTDICIFIIKHKPLSVMERFKQIPPTQLSMSAITFAELINGAKKSQQIDANIKRLNGLGDMLEIRPFDRQAAIIYSDIRSKLEKRGEVIGAYDLLIAAHALSLERTLVTNNVREFERVKGLKIENWTAANPQDSKEIQLKQSPNKAPQGKK